MVSVLVCMVTHWIGPIGSHDIRLLDSHNFSKLIYHFLIRGGVVVYSVFEIGLLGDKSIRRLMQSI